VHLVVPQGRLTPQMELALYYVVSEAITNAHKHAGAQTITVSVAPGPFDVRAVIEDDGVGGARVRFGGGLHGIDDRVRAMGGSMVLDDRPEGGTRLTVVLPWGGDGGARRDR